MRRQLCLCALLAMVLAGCANRQHGIPETHSPAELDAISSTLRQLQQGPQPQITIPVSVYAFRDQTGQYKQTEHSSSFSTAVTQGGTAMLTQILLHSGWFSPLEREGLQNLLTERKIHSNNKQNKELPVLAEARLLLEGGIVAYETNLNSGGVGAEYFGIGLSELYREDRVTVYLRAVDVHSGQVLLSVAANKKVFSHQLRSGLFRYVSLNRLAEMEAGYSSNEPVQYCVQQALELAVLALVEQGKAKGFWQATR